VKYVCWRGFQARAATAESNTHTATDTKLEKVAAAEASGPAVVVVFPAPARAITSVVAVAAVVELSPVCNRECGRGKPPRHKISIHLANALHFWRRGRGEKKKLKNPNKKIQEEEEKVGIYLLHRILFCAWLVADGFGSSVIPAAGRTDRVQARINHEKGVVSRDGWWRDCTVAPALTQRHPLRAKEA